MDSITGLKVKTLINGEKRDIGWLGTRVRRGRQMTLRKDRNRFSASENSIRKVSKFLLFD